MIKILWIIDIAMCVMGLYWHLRAYWREELSRTIRKVIENANQ